MKYSAENRDSKVSLCDASTVLFQLSYQANRELALIWVDHRPVVVEIDDDNYITIFHVFEMWIGMNEFDHSILAVFKHQRERPEKFRPEWAFDPDICDASAVLYQLNYQAIWELAIMWVNVEIDEDNTRVFHVFEMWIGKNEFDHGILALFKNQREGPEKFRPEWRFES